MKMPLSLKALLAPVLFLLSAAACASSQPIDLPQLSARDHLAAGLEGGPRGACDRSASVVCYDLADRRIVYRRARQYMPKLDGLTAESVSLRRDGIRFKYSFR